MIPKRLINQATPIIEKIAKSRKTKDYFAYYTPEDIYQEVWLLCLEALPRYEKKLGELEHFLNKHISNRLKNLKRDKYFRIDNNTSKELLNTRINLVNAIPIGDNNLSGIRKIFISDDDNRDPIDYIIEKELKEYIYEKLSIEYRHLFKILINGQKINKNNLQKLRHEVLMILKEIEDNER